MRLDQATPFTWLAAPSPALPRRRVPADTSAGTLTGGRGKLWCRRKCHVLVGLMVAATMRMAPAPAAVRAADPSAMPAVQLARGDAAIEDPASVPARSVLTAEDERFLDDLERRGIRYFVDEADPVSGLIPDRAKASGGSSAPCSIAAVGFGLTALCIGDERKWTPHQEAYDRSLRALRFLRYHVEREHGFFYHFIDMHTGRRVWKCEVSDVDTAILMAGALTARQHFTGTELARIADQLFREVDWPWLQSPDGTLYMGWKPETGFIQARWARFSEGPPLIYLLAMASPSHPLSPRVWRAWRREPVIRYAGLTFMQCPPLFTHQYPQAWFDLRGLRDDWADYFRNSQLATLAQRQWCIDEMAKRFGTYGPNMWGITASDSAIGYTAWGGPPQQGEIDGSVVPCAAAGSLVFQPRLCLDALEAMRKKCGDTGYLKYGFVDAFNPATGWYDPDVIGIDVGPTVLMAENCRTALIWRTFMSAPEVRAGLKAAHFRPVNHREALASTTSLFGSK